MAIRVFCTHKRATAKKYRLHGSKCKEQILTAAGMLSHQSLTQPVTDLVGGQ